MTTLLAVNNYHYRRGGAEVVFLEHNAALRERGWQVIPFAMQHPENLPSEWSSHFAQEVEYGHRYGPLRLFRNAGRTIYSFDARARIQELIDETRPDIAHIHNIYHHLSPSILWALRKANIPVVMSVHDLKIACPAYTMYSRGEVCERCRNGNLTHVIRRRCIKGSLPLSALVFVESSFHRLLNTWSQCVDIFVVHSRFYLEKLVEWGFDRSRFVYIPNAIPAGEVVPSKPGESFLYFGRLGPEKGLGTLIRAAAVSKCPVVLAGQGPEENALRRLVEELNAPVRFAGYLDQEALSEELHHARAVVLHSEWYENAPKSVLEAYAQGRVVIASDIGGNPELVRDRETGFIVPAGNVEVLAKVMQQVNAMSDDTLLQMGLSAQAWVNDEFSEERYMRRFLDVYGRLGVS